jgi:hypothetical protein
MGKIFPRRDIKPFEGYLALYWFNLFPGGMLIFSFIPGGISKTYSGFNLYC